MNPYSVSLKTIGTAAAIMTVIVALGVVLYTRLDSNFVPLTQEKMEKFVLNQPQISPGIYMPYLYKTNAVTMEIPDHPTVTFSNNILHVESFGDFPFNTIDCQHQKYLILNGQYYLTFDTDEITRIVLLPINEGKLHSLDSNFVPLTQEKMEKFVNGHENDGIYTPSILLKLNPDDDYFMRTYTEITFSDNTLHVEDVGDFSFNSIDCQHEKYLILNRQNGGQLYLTFDDDTANNILSIAGGKRHSKKRKVKRRRSYLKTYKYGP